MNLQITSNRTLYYSRNFSLYNGNICPKMDAYPVTLLITDTSTEVIRKAAALIKSTVCVDYNCENPQESVSF